jgi:hypothetical protein
MRLVGIWLHAAISQILHKVGTRRGSREVSWENKQKNRKIQGSPGHLLSFLQNTNFYKMATHGTEMRCAPYAKMNREWHVLCRYLV